MCHSLRLLTASSFDYIVPFARQQNDSKIQELAIIAINSWVEMGTLPVALLAPTLSTAIEILVLESTVFPTSKVFDQACELITELFADGRLTSMERVPAPTLSVIANLNPLLDQSIAIDSCLALCKLLTSFGTTFVAFLIDTESAETEIYFSMLFKCLMAAPLNEAYIQSL